MTVCPKCQYRRLASDTAPDWQCPKCGVAYAKVAATPSRTSARDRDKEDIHPAAPPMSGKSIAFIVLLLLVVGFGAWKTTHSSSAPSSVSERFDMAKKAYEAQDFQTATREFTALAEAGDAKAQYYLGRIYAHDWRMTGFNGKSVNQRSDREKSVFWFEKAAEQGDVLAQVELGDIFRHNLGGGTNPNGDAAKWYRMAADQGDAKAQYFLGTFYEHGRGVPEDAAQASIWYRAAGTQDHAGGLFGLATLLAKGNGVPENKLAAYELLILAAKQNDRDPSVEGAFWARENAKQLAKQLSATEIAQAENHAAAWRPGQPLPR